MNIIDIYDKLKSSYKTISEVCLYKDERIKQRSVRQFRMKIMA